MIRMEDMVMFVPACGWGERLKMRGAPKPFLYVFEEQKALHWMALNKVIDMAPEKMEIEIALRREMGCPDLARLTTVHFMEPTTGQAQTIWNWLSRTRIRSYVLISNCDNAIDQQSVLDGINVLAPSNYLVSSRKGIIYTFRPKKEGDNRWSYVKRDPVTGKILAIKEKEAISEDAVAGVYLLNMFELRMAIHSEDIYLSQALARMGGLYAFRAREYIGWNDMEQLDELEKGVAQSL